MGDITRGFTFSDGGTYPAAQVHKFVDDATINPFAITNDKIAPGAVTADKLAPGAVTAAAIDQATQTDTSQYAVDTGAANAYVIALTPPATAYTEGMAVAFKAANANTGVSTLNVNGLGVKTIKKNGTIDLTAGDILAGMLYELRYDGTNFQLLAAIEITRLPNETVVDLTNDKLLLYDNSVPGYKKVSPISIFNQRIDRAANGGRLTLQSATPITLNDVTAAPNLYFTSYNSNQVALYDGTNWDVYAFSEITLSLATVTAGTNYDVFIFNNAGTLTLELTAWTNNTTRATALALQDGVYVKSGALTRRYLGSLRASANAQCEDSKQNRFLFNYLNRHKRLLLVNEPASSWSYTTPTWRIANNNSNNFVSLMNGILDSFADIKVLAQCVNVNNTITGTGIGVDSTSVNSGDIVGGIEANDSVGIQEVEYCSPLTLGVTTFNWLEKSGPSGATTSWYGTFLDIGKSGIYGTFHC